MAVEGVSGAGGKPDAAKAKGAPGAAFPKVGGASAPARSGAEAAVAKKTGGYQIANPQPIRPAETAPAPVRPEVAMFAQGMVQAADAAAMPGPTTDGDLLPRESVSGMFMRDFALQGAVALGRPPLGEDEATRLVIEKHIAGTPGVYYDADIDACGEGAYLVKLHRLNNNPPFLPDPRVEASYRIDRRTWQIEEVR